jgi:hypothetical protein
LFSVAALPAMVLFVIASLLTPTAHNLILETPYLIAAYAAFDDEAFESFIVDTDHWRHFFCCSAWSGA